MVLASIGGGINEYALVVLALICSLIFVACAQDAGKELLTVRN